MADLISTSDISAVPELAALASRSDVANIITATSQLIEARVGRSFGSASRTDTQNGMGTPRLWLKYFPVTAVASVSIAGEDLDNTDGNAWKYVPATGELIRGNGKNDPRFGPVFPRGLQNVVIVYTAGEAVPARVKQACLALLKWVIGGAARDGSLTELRLGDFSEKYAAMGSNRLPPVVESLLSGLSTDFFL